MKRIFVGIKISDEIKQAAAVWQNSRADLPVRWLAPDNLHLTIVPPREADDKEIKEIISKLEKVKTQSGPFNLRFTEISYGPNSHKPRLICALGKTPTALIELKNMVELALGKGRVARPFLLHLTLARFKTENFSSFKVKKLRDKIFWQQRVDGFQLIESVLTSGGAKYKVLAEVIFQAQ